MKRLVLAALAVALGLFAPPARAVDPGEMLANPALEARAEAVGRELRCLVCRNQSVEDSDAGLAHDLRVLIRRRISRGESNAQVVAYIRSRYGDFVLLKPPFKPDTLLLWGGPLILVLIGAGLAWRYYRAQPAATGTSPLSDDERRRLDALFEDETPS